MDAINRAAESATPRAPYIDLHDVDRVGIDRPFVRRLFAKVVEANTGETTFLEKCLIAGAWLFSPAALVVSAVTFGVRDSLVGALAIPVVVIGWVVYSRRRRPGSHRVHLRHAPPPR